MKKYLVVLMLCCLVLLSTLMERCKNSNAQPPITAGQIRGYVYATAFNNPDNKKDTSRIEQIFIPDVLVTIIDKKGNIIDSAMSQLDGSYITKKVALGSYQLNFQKKGFINTAHNINITTNINFPGPLPINYNSKNYVWGIALLQDNTSGYYSQDVFNVNYDTKISIANDTSATVRCNIYGYYLTTYSPSVTSSAMNAVCQSISANQALVNNGRVDFTFKNFNPHIPEVRAFDNGKFVQRTHPGAALKLIAVSNDSDKDVLQYSWKIGNADPTPFTSANNNAILWNVPADTGLYTIDVMAIDKKGGAAYTSYGIEVGDEKVSFSGNVTDIFTKAVIPNAKVTVAGDTTQTDAQGNFNIKVPQANGNDRYILNIEKAGYCLRSLIYFKDEIGIPYKLVPSYTETFNPTTDIVLVEKQDSFTRFSQTITTIDSNNQVTKKQSERIAATVKIPANSIVDASGLKVTTPVTVSIRAIDIFNPEGLLPGDFGAIQNGQQVRLETFGAVDVQIRDKANPAIKYKLDKSAAAEITSPIPSAIQSGASLKSKIVLWDYNDSTGLWEDIGMLMNAGNHFVGKTNRFSVLNGDDAFANATMMRLIDNVNHPLPTGNIQIQIFAPNDNGGADFRHQITINRAIAGNLPVYVPRLAPNRVYTITLIRNGTVLNTINARTKGIVPGAEQWDPTVTNTTYQGINNPNIIDVPLLPDVLHLSSDQLNRFLDFVKNDHGNADAINYYRLINAYNFNGVAHDTVTFTQWKTHAGFVAAGAGTYNAVYFNNGDLRFWRSMHQQTNAGVISYYVTNYNNEVDAINNGTHGAIATVCMEYSPIIAGGTSVTKFYVFDGPTGHLLNSANLDANTTTSDGSNGQKFVPGLCITCHGGEYLTDYSTFAQPADLQNHFNDVNNASEIPKFIAFDAKSYFYSQIAGFTRNDQEESLRNLNQVILSTNKTDAIRDFINSSYNSHIGTAGQKYVDNAVVPGWNSTTLVHGVTPTNFYTDVVGPSCRSCHNSRSFDGHWFDTQTKFTTFGGSINIAVCVGNHVPPPSALTRFMPNSKVTFLNFWTSENPRQYDQLRQYLNLPACNRP